MKLLFENKRYILLIALTIFIVFCTHISSDADENRAPVFSEGARATRAVAENTAPGTNIGAAFTATDPDSGDTLTYSLHRGDKDSFRIDPNTGQLQTRTALDYETKNSYTDLAVRVTDSSGLTDAILVTINVTDVKENRGPVFIDGGRAIRTIAENTPADVNIGTPVAATDADNDVLTYSLGWPQESSSFSIDSTTGQIRTKAPLDYETKNAYHFAVFVNDGKGGRLAISVTINVTDVVNEPTPVNQRTQQVQDAIVAAIEGVDSADDVTAAHLATITSLNLYGNNFRFLKAGDFDGLTSLTNLELGHGSFDALPSGIFDQLTALTTLGLGDNWLTRSIASLPSGIFDNNTKLTTLNLSGNALTSLPSGIFDNNTKLTTLDLESNDFASLSSNIFDELAALTDLNLANNALTSLPSGIFDNNTALTTLKLYWNNISDVSELEDLTALTTLDLYNNSISDISALEDLTALTTLRLHGNPILDYGPLRRLKTANPNVNININLNNNLPVFSDGGSATRSVAENTASDTNIGEAVSATDADDDTLTYTLGGTDAESFSIVSTSGQLQTSAALDYETKSSYEVTVTAYDGNSGAGRITVTINVTDVAGAAPSVETSPVIPENTALLTNFPNPFNPETWIPYQLAKPADVTLTIYNMRGVVVRELKLGHQSAGVYTSRSRAIHWDGRNMFGEKVATGVYFYTLKADDFTATRKMLISK